MRFTSVFQEAIGFKHWILVIAVVGVIYAGVVYLHRCVFFAEFQIVALGFRAIEVGVSFF